MAGRKKKSFLYILIFSLAIALGVTLALEPFAKFVYPLKHKKVIEECADSYGLDKYLVMGIISTESNFNSDAQSHKDAHGLMQIKDETALWCVEHFSLDIGEEDIRKPENNIRIGCAYMSYLFKKEIGVGFSDYVWKMRFEKACELLAERKLSVDEVSLAVGYLHSSSFRRKFKQETGLSPTEYITEHTPKPESAVGAETLY